LFRYNDVSKEQLTSHRHLFHVHNKQCLLCTSGNFHAICSCQSKDM